MPNRRWQNGESKKGWRRDADLGQLFWQQILGGPRPPSVRWPKAQKSHDRGGAGAPVQPCRDAPARRSPDEVVNAAQERVQKLERALEVLGEDSGPEYQVLHNSLKKAKAAAQGVPIGVQLEESLKFIERSEKRLRILDEERAKEATLLEEAKERVARLRSELVVETPRQHPPPTAPANYAVELAQLRACVDELQREREDLRAELSKRGERRSRGRSRSLPNPSTGLFTGELQRVSAVNRGNHHPLSGMETMIDQGDTLSRGNRYNPLA